MSASFRNINSLTGYLLIEELVRNGVTRFCISPGSRSTPLAVAAAENPRAETHVILDERASAFFALGLARSGLTTAVITTSGSAIANLVPAVVEADNDCLPLVLLTADRPPELVHTGANQTINQTAFFQNHVRWQFNLPAFEASSPAQQRFCLKTIAEMVFRSRGGSGSPGPVHLNCHFREPLGPGEADSSKEHTPLPAWYQRQGPWCQFHLPGLLSDFSALKHAIYSARSGLIVVGQLYSQEERESVLSICEKLDWPVMADITSNLRGRLKNFISYFDYLLCNKDLVQKLKPDLVLHLGDQLVSKRIPLAYEQWLPARLIRISPRSKRFDEGHVFSERYLADFSGLAKALDRPVKKSAVLDGWQGAGLKLQQRFDFDRFSTPGRVETITACLKGRPLLLASSLPVREFDWFSPGGDSLFAANRGASGIDGTLATGCGFSTGLRTNGVLYTGDLALFYDISSLKLVRDYQLLVIVNNNSGGGIFSLLPVKQQFEKFDQYFQTDQKNSIEQISRAYGLEYARCDENQQLQKAMNEMPGGVIEIVSTADESQRLNQHLKTCCEEDL